MKRLLLITFVLTLLSNPSFSQEKIPVWGAFFFDMKRHEAIYILKKHCKSIDYESKVRAGITGKECYFPFEPFQGIETSINLTFDFAIFKINKRLQYVGFNFDDKERDQLVRLYKYSKDNWLISSKWKCSNPTEFSSISLTSQTCGASFNKGTVVLTNSTSLDYRNKKNSKPRLSRTTSMYFYAFEPKHTLGKIL